MHKVYSVTLRVPALPHQRACLGNQEYSPEQPVLLLPRQGSRANAPPAVDTVFWPHVTRARWPISTQADKTDRASSLQNEASGLVWSGNLRCMPAASS